MLFRSLGLTPASAAPVETHTVAASAAAALPVTPATLAAAENAAAAIPYWQVRAHTLGQHRRQFQ